MKKGSCLCGAVTYEATGPLRPVLACHCIQCRKQTGHYLASTNSKEADFKLLTSDTLKWYRASDFASRGFCGTCGSVMFWKHDDADSISISAGSIDGPTGLSLDGHIYCAYAGDYYEITGGSYQLPEWK
jgi:hypothetical protein